MAEVLVREFVVERDIAAVEAVEKKCQVGPTGKPSLYADLMGDPISRIRHFRAHIMLVAEYGEEEEIVGVIRGCVKTVSRGKKPMSEFPIYTKVGYLLGLRVSPTHRRLGVATKLVQKLEEWCKQNGAEYAYMATDRANEPSINLFTLKCAYSKFRTPCILAQPVHAHQKRINPSISIVRLSPALAESIYRHVFASCEFFPKDIDVIFSNKLNLGTFMALPKKSLAKWEPKTGQLPQTYALLSIWNSKEVFKLQVKGVSRLTYAWCVGSRAVDVWFPWMKIPSVPDVFRPFGVYFLYGLHAEGKGGVGLVNGLCRFAHNMARRDAGCSALVAELGRSDPVIDGVPHWKRFSWAEDVWCMKSLGAAEEGCAADWVRSRPSSPVVFVDPRDF